MISTRPLDQNSLTYRKMFSVGTLILLAFAIDLMIPLGVSLGVLYVWPLLLTLPLKEPRFTRTVSLTATVLIIGGYWISAGGGEPWIIMTNRTISLVTVWLADWIVLRTIRVTLLHESLQRQFLVESEESVKQFEEKHNAILNILEDMEQAKNAFKKSEERNRLIIEASPSGLVMIDRQGIIILANILMAQQFGYRQDELPGQSVEILVPAQFRDHHPGHRTAFFSAPEHRKMGSGRNLYGLRKDGTEFPVEIGLNPLTMEGSIFVLASVVDITVRKKTEDALFHSMEELNRSNQELDDFAYIAAHDLKEPLRGISNYSAILLEDYGSKLDEEARHKCETLLRLSRRMEELIDSLHYFSRAGRTELAKRPTDLQHVLDDVLDSIDFGLKDCGVDIRIPRSLPTVTCDSVRTVEIFRNLITNAMKYNDKDEKWIEIGYIEADEEAAAIDSKTSRSPVFYVRDNGIGIREKHLAPLKNLWVMIRGLEAVI
ncbi:MAG: PAS domain S-box protein, partial [Nitrospirales bacterium]